MRNVWVVALILMSAMTSFAAVPLVHLIGDLAIPSGGTPTNVQITLTPSGAFNLDDTITGSVGRHIIGAFPVTYNVTDSTSVNIYVAPNTGGFNPVPDSTYYSVVLKAGGKTYTAIWQVTYSASPVRIADVVVTQPAPTTSSFLPISGGTETGLVNFNDGFRLTPGTAPSGPTEGRWYYDSTTHLPYYRNHLSAWVPIGSNLSTVSHDGTLSGDGTGGSPLTVLTSALVHNSLGGLTTGNPHTQYVLKDGSTAFTGNQSFGGFQATNFVLENRMADVTGAVTGRVWIDNTAVPGVVKWNNGVSVINPLARANHSGTQLAATISDFTAAVISAANGGALNYLLKAGGTMSGDLNLGGNQIRNFRADTQSSNPAASSGRQWFNTTTGRMMWYDGSLNVDPVTKTQVNGITLEPRTEIVNYGSGLTVTNTVSGTVNITAAGGGGGSAGFAGPGDVVNLRVKRTGNNTIWVRADSISLSDGTDWKSYPTVNVTLDVSAGIGANGPHLASTDVADTWIGVYLIGKDDGTIATLGVTNTASPVLPATYTRSRRISAGRNDGSSNLVTFQQVGNYAMVDSQARALSAGAASSFTTVSLSSFIPPFCFDVQLFVERASGTDIIVDVRGDSFFDPDGFAYAFRGSAATQSVHLRVPTSDTQSVDYRITNAAGTINLVVYGFYLPF